MNLFKKLFKSNNNQIKEKSNQIKKEEKDLLTRYGLVSIEEYKQLELNEKCFAYFLSELIKLGYKATLFDSSRRFYTQISPPRGLFYKQIYVGVVFANVDENCCMKIKISSYDLKINKIATKNDIDMFLESAEFKKFHDKSVELHQKNVNHSMVWKLGLSK